MTFLYSTCFYTFNDISLVKLHCSQLRFLKKYVCYKKKRVIKNDKPLITKEIRKSVILRNKILKKL